jgi:hypothetical protein
MQRHDDAPVYSQSALGRGRGMKGKLLTMAALELRRGFGSRDRAKNAAIKKSPTGPKASRSEK